jgi:hypothetical protein
MQLPYLTPPTCAYRCLRWYSDWSVQRNGTATLFAALNTFDGTVISMCDDRHRHQEWLKFLRVIDELNPEAKEIHIIADNYATHKHPKVQRWLDRHPASRCISRQPAALG